MKNQTYQNQGKKGGRGPEFYDMARQSINDKAHKLNAHTKRNTNLSHINYEVYHLLCDPFTFNNSYTPVSKNKGALTKGVEQDAEVMKLFGKDIMKKISNQFRRRKYKWQPVRRTLVQKPGKKKGKMRPIDTPTQQDRIVQEALRGILEAIYEPEFREFETRTRYYCSNYGFRPMKSTWFAVNNLKLKGRGTTIAIEGDIVGAYNNVNHDILLAILGRRIKDKQFLQVIKDLLKSGVMHKGTYIHSLVGTPQGGIVSPLLFNIYMFEFDKFIWENYIQSTFENVEKPVNHPEYKRVSYQMTKVLDKYRTTAIIEDRFALRKEYKRLQKLRYKIPHSIPGSLPEHAIYARYADDWVLLTTSTHERAAEIKEEITAFLLSELRMELDKEKTLISTTATGFSFLGFHIKACGNDQIKKAYVLKYLNNKNKPTTRYQKRTTSKVITVYPDSERIHTNLLRKKFCVGPNLNPVAKSEWTVLDEYEIVLKFQQTFMGLANYYRWTDGFYALNRVSYILQYSCAKTLSYRQKSSVSKIFKKYGKNMEIRREIKGSSGSKFKQIAFLTHAEVSKKFKEDKTLRPKLSEAPHDPFKIITYWRTKFKVYSECCICGRENDIHLHHINSLRSIKAKKETDHFGYIRSCLNRLQIPVCPSCHSDITHGKYSDKSPIEFYDLFIARL